MAINFSSSAGQAKKANVDYFKFKDGTNRFRLFGDVLPRYVYWVPGTNNKNIPIECLAFDRDEERFTNAEEDVVRPYLEGIYGEDSKQANCSWSYMMQGIDLDNNKVVAIGLKKKMFQQIKDAAEHLGDPTDPENGWDVVVKRKKTGPHAFNVEYTVDVLACKNRPLTEEEQEMIAEAKSLDELFPRQTPEEQQKFLDKLNNEEEESAEDHSDEVGAFDNDTPFDAEESAKDI